MNSLLASVCVCVCVCVWFSHFFGVDGGCNLLIAIEASLDAGE